MPVPLRPACLAETGKNSSLRSARHIVSAKSPNCTGYCAFACLQFTWPRQAGRHPLRRTCARVSLTQKAVCSILSILSLHFPNLLNIFVAFCSAKTFAILSLCCRLPAAGRLASVCNLIVLLFRFGHWKMKHCQLIRAKKLIIVSPACLRQADGEFSLMLCAFLSQKIVCALHRYFRFMSASQKNLQ